MRPSEVGDPVMDDMTLDEIRGWHRDLWTELNDSRDIDDTTMVVLHFVEASLLAVSERSEGAHALTPEVEEIASMARALMRQLRDPTLGTVMTRG